MDDADTPTPDTETASEVPPTGSTDAGDTTDWKARSREWERRAKANADAARRLQAMEDEKKTETERLSERVQAAETAAAQARVEALRYRIGLAAGIPAEFIPRLQGATEEELQADAEALAKALPQAPKGQPLTTKPLASLSLGATPEDEQKPVDGNEAIRRLLSRKS